MSDEAVIVRDQGTIFLGGPPLVKAATGEEVTAEELGGGDAAHPGQRRHRPPGRRRRARAADRPADRRHARPARAPAVGRRAGRGAAVRRPRACYDVVPADTRTPYDVREVIARLVDGSRFAEFKPLYGHDAGHRLRPAARPPGRDHRQQRRAVQRVRAQGRALHRAVRPARKIPLLFLQNISGFMVGRDYEAGGIAKHGAKMVTAVASARVPKLTVVIGGSFGAGNYVDVRPGVLAALPVHLAQRAHLGDGRRAGGQRAGHGPPRRARGPRARSGRAEDEEAFKAPIRDQYEDQGHPYYATARLWDDGVIDPAETRTVLGLALSACANAPLEEVGYGVFRM